MTDFLLIEDKELYYLLAENYLLTEFSESIASISIEDVVEYIEDKKNLNIANVYYKYGEDAWMELLGQWIATQRHMVRVYDTIPADGTKFYFEQEENEGKRNYINRLIGNAQFDHSAKIMGKFEHGRHELWFNVRPEDTYESILIDLEECLSSWGEK